MRRRDKFNARFIVRDYHEAKKITMVPAARIERASFGSEPKVLPLNDAGIIGGWKPS